MPVQFQSHGLELRELVPVAAGFGFGFFFGESELMAPVSLQSLVGTSCVTKKLRAQMAGRFLWPLG